jgi:aryl-alcohol dehydrogenase-like predicted oxidoreductase
MHLNDARVSESEAGRLLNQVLDAGVNLIDTARGYGLSEERIGRHLAHRRPEFLLSTKVGYGIPGVADWTYDCILTIWTSFISIPARCPSSKTAG